ncbi:PREDICTED: arginine-glutamic acid dipeptide repeats protein-like [Branchiostoma belcheri]|uniref:Arginine-glutamic acid dipeptide repeats protein-like n=1 Tax=Branchiostoma belcheri TaxID=7741 RepID=A0A6P5AE37_BRABE|nr:PREDICTED: arginine-glutamic acid dipeptide repeats protein-like [Branchiostoma belcheri]
MEGLSHRLTQAVSMARPSRLSESAAVKSIILLWFPDEKTWADCPTKRVIPVEHRGNLKKGGWTPVVFDGKPTKGYIVEYSDDKDVVMNAIIKIDNEDYMSTLPRSEQDAVGDLEVRPQIAHPTSAEVPPVAEVPPAPVAEVPQNEQTDQQGKQKTKKGGKRKQPEGDSSTKPKKKKQAVPRNTRAGHHALIDVTGATPCIVPMNQIEGWKTVDLLQDVEFKFSNSKRRGKLIMTSETGDVLSYMRDKIMEGKENLQPAGKESTPKKSGNKQAARRLHRTATPAYVQMAPGETNCSGGASASALRDHTNIITLTPPRVTQTQPTPSLTSTPVVTQTEPTHPPTPVVTQTEPTHPPTPVVTQTEPTHPPNPTPVVTQTEPTHPPNPTPVVTQTEPTSFPQTSELDSELFRHFRFC